MRVAPNTYAGGSPRWKITHQLLGIPRECLVTPQRVAPRERGDPLRRVVPNTPILLSTAGVYFGIYFEFDGRNSSSRTTMLSSAAPCFHTQASAPEARSISASECLHKKERS